MGECKLLINALYAFEEYTQIKHVMIELNGEVRKSWHYTVFGDAE